MSNPNDGGPAFPYSHVPSKITVRDVFALGAMMATLSRTSVGSIESAAPEFYRMADAMLAARAPKEKS